MEIVSAATLMLLVLDSLGSIPIFLSVPDTVKPERRRVVLIRELLLALPVVFLFLGNYVLQLPQLSQHALSISGGVVREFRHPFLCRGLQKFPGRRGLIGMERLMGMLLVAPAVRMLLNDIEAWLQELPV
jgi:small neutral amino acid transporter SnatA (MarC family)